MRACVRVCFVLNPNCLSLEGGGGKRQELAASGGRAGGEELAWESQPILHARRVCKL